MAVRTVNRESLGWQIGDELKARLGSLAYVEAGKRDLRLDFLRGLAVAVMVVDHMGGETLLTTLSGGNQFIVSAAEAFVFLSGLVLGMVYGDRFLRAGPGEAIRGLLHRAFTLYKASVGMALSFLVLYLFTGIRLWTDRILPLPVSSPFEAVLGVFSLHFAFHGSDVLVMYTLMLLAAPGIIYLLYRGRSWMVVLGSIALWAFYQRYPVQATVPWAVQGSSFPVPAWQLLFVLGIVAGYHRQALLKWLLSGTRFARGLLMAVGVGVYLLSWSYEQSGASLLPAGWPSYATYANLFAKTELGPGRVVAFLGMAIMAFVIVHALWVPLMALLGWFLVPLGQSALYVYITHIFVLVVLYNLAPLLTWASLSTINLAAQLVALGTVWILVRSRFLYAIVPR